MVREYLPGFPGRPIISVVEHQRTNRRKLPLFILVNSAPYYRKHSSTVKKPTRVEYTFQRAWKRHNNFRVVDKVTHSAAHLSASADLFSHCWCLPVVVALSGALSTSSLRRNILGRPPTLRRRLFAIDDGSQVIASHLARSIKSSRHRTLVAAQWMSGLVSLLVMVMRKGDVLENYMLFLWLNLTY